MNGADARQMSQTGRTRADIMMLGLRTVSAGQGGVEAHVDNLVSELDKLGLSVLVAIRSGYSNPGPGRGRATRFVPIWAPRSHNWESVVHSTLAGLYAVLHRPRIVHVHAIGPSLVVPLLRLAGLKVVTTHHGEDYNREKWGPIASGALRLGEYCQGMFANARICVSRSLSRRLEREFRRPFFYVPNGVRPVVPVAETEELRRHGLVPGQYVLTVGRLVPEKRHLDLIAAFEKLGRPNFQLAIVGAADHPTPYSQALTRRAQSVPNVIMTGLLTGSELQQMFSHAGVFALPSTHEGLPIALLEAMAFHCKVVASDIVPNRDIGLPDSCYHKVGDIDDLRGKLDVALSEKVTHSGRDWSDLLGTFDWPAIARKTIEIYSTVSPSIGMAR